MVASSSSRKSLIQKFMVSPPARRSPFICARTLRCSARLDVAEQQIRLGPVAFRKLGIEIREDVQLGGQRLAIVHVVGVFSGPEERFAGNAFQTLQIDAVARQQLRILIREIVADDPPPGAAW